MHFEQELEKSKTSINVVWKTFMSSNQIPYPPKIKVFTSVFRSIIDYGHRFGE